MQINGISTVAPIVASKSPTAAPTTASASSAGGKSATSTSPTTSGTSTASKSGSGLPRVPLQSEASAVSTATSTLSSPTYSTSVGGKSYSANVSQANGTYTLSVSNLPGASVTGSSLSAAEIALTVKIDTLV